MWECGKPIGFSIFPCPGARGKRGGDFLLEPPLAALFGSPFPPSRPQAFPAAAEKSGVYFGLRIPDGAMYPEYQTGDIVIARRQDSARDGEDAVVSVGGEDAALRRILRAPEGLLLLPLNAVSVAPSFYSERQVRALPVRILGVCVEMRRKKDLPEGRS